MISVTIPIKIDPTANKCEIRKIVKGGKPIFFRTKKSKEKRIGHRKAIILTLQTHPNISLPCKIHLIRIAPRELDEDNLPNAFKSITDDIADFLIPGLPRGHADGDKRLQWKYSQEKGNPKEYALRIEILENI